MISQLVSPTAKTSTETAIAVPGLHPSTYKVYAAIPARVYHASFATKQSEWIFSGLGGNLMFGRDRGPVDAQAYWFRLLDDNGKTIWIFKIPEIPEKSFEYRIDKPFFHVFQGSSRKFGFLYYDDNEAAGFAKKVLGRTTPRHSAESSLVAMAAELPRSIRSRLASSAMGRLSPAIISAPTTNSFVHVAHVGKKKTSPPFVEPDLNELGDPSWTMILAELPDEGVRRGTILEQHDIADEYMMKGPHPIPVEDNKQNLVKPRKVRRKPSPKVTL
ncbi:hypothetical protein C8F04DRAFT_1362918 [Mycena alexandri]|uniref:Uncharacterized protein n=1 Tax=Mycena alexandri TaxID=1745969 RepID=A0AAD6SPY9_9AGAR|nr:hypothetical protein C8F04DRAFT_1362918 [Mycena alexandri]